MNIVADLHLHSKYSRAVSPQMMPEFMGKYAKQKGLDLLATGDFTHPLWYRELKNTLEETEEGIYSLKDKGLMINDKGLGHGPELKSKGINNKETRFLFSVEISCIYTQKGKGRRVHNLVFAPDFKAVESINKELIKRGYNLSSDGRPIIGLSSKNLLQLIMEIDERCILIPAHIWTPWFGVLGAASGFNSLEECFEDLTPYIYGIETGLSSDPEMNWQLKELETRSILSFSDAHSLPKMGREATIFKLESLSYANIRKAIMAPSNNQKATKGTKETKETNVLLQENGENKVLYTLEFYPEEGKYHYSGHRVCNVTMTPIEQKENNGICPVCKKSVTDGVMRRVQELAVSHLSLAPGQSINDKRPASDQNLATGDQINGVKWYNDPLEIHPPFVKLVPLNEIIAESIGSPVGSPKVKLLFDTLCKELRSEIYILLEAEIEDIKKFGGIWGGKIADGVQRVREGEIVIKPGYDGVYGVVKIWNEDKPPSRKATASQRQMGLF